MSLGRVGRHEQAQSTALASVVDEAQAAARQAAVVNMDETVCRLEPRRAWLWTVVSAELTVCGIGRSRGRSVVKALLGSAFTRVVDSDRRSVYMRCPAERRGLCYAHLGRFLNGKIPSPR